MDWIPACSDAIDPVWLTEALAPRYAGVRVARVEVSERVELTNHHARQERDPPRQGQLA